MHLLLHLNHQYLKIHLYLILDLIRLFLLLLLNLKYH